MSIHVPILSVPGEPLMTPSTSAVLLVAVLCVLWWFQSSSSAKQKQIESFQKLPGPPRTPILGITPYMSKHVGDMWPRIVQEWSVKLGSKTFGGPMAPLPTIPTAYFCTSTEESVRHVLKDNFDNYVKGTSFQEAFREMLGKGIFAADGPTWHRHRKITSRMFSVNLLKASGKIISEKLNQLDSIFQSKLADQSSLSVDIQDIFFRFTFDTATFVAFGAEYDSLGSDTQHDFATCFDRMEVLLTNRLRDPLFQVKRALRLTAEEREIARLKVQLDNHALSIVHGRRRSSRNSHNLGPDLLSRFIDFSKSKDGEVVSDEELRDMILNTLVAGRDTTACALSWGMYELLKHPRVVEKMIEESNRICAGTDYSYETCNGLEYIHAVVLEVLRLYPSVPCDGMIAVNDDVLPDGTFIPAGSFVGCPPYVVNRNVAIWGEDATKFRPERFLERSEPSPYAYPVFNAGPRYCLGRPLAMMTLKMTFAYLLPRYQFRDVLGHSGDCIWALTMSMKDGFEVEVSTK